VPLTGDGFAPGSTGQIIFESTPTVIGSFTADAQGRVNTQATVPSSAEAGAHHMVLRGTAPSGAVREVSKPVTVTAALTRTGVAHLRDLVGLALVVLGAAWLMLSVAGGRRRPDAAHFLR
jgi:hypothetical protein